MAGVEIVVLPVIQSDGRTLWLLPGGIISRPPGSWYRFWIHHVGTPVRVLSSWIGLPSVARNG